MLIIGRSLAQKPGIVGRCAYEEAALMAGCAAKWGAPQR